MKHLLFLLVVVSLTSCSENFSNGERIGLVTQFSQTGLICKSWEGHLNMTQTGMNSSQPFDFSVDRDNEPQGLVAKLDSAARFGYKVQLKYHETFGWNWFNNRGDTNHFITECNILDKTPMQSIFGQSNTGQHGVVRDTIYVVIFKNK